MPESQLPIPGTVIDPPAKPHADKIRAVERRTRLGAVIYLAILRFGSSHATLLAGGSTYYMFLGMLSAIFLAFGLVARFGSELLAPLLTEALNAVGEIFPDFIGAKGIDPDLLQSWGQGASFVSLLVLLYSGTGTVNALSGGLHIVYGAPKDPRNLPLKKLRQVGWLLLLVPLFLLAVIPTVVVGLFGSNIRSWLGVGDSSWGPAVLTIVGVAVGSIATYILLRIVLSRLGGIRPDKQSLHRGSLLGAVVIEIMRYGMAAIAQWAVARPQYGAFALPVAILFVIYLQWLVFFFVASLTAAMASFRGMPQSSGQVAPAGNEDQPDGPQDLLDDSFPTEEPAQSDAGEMRQDSAMWRAGSEAGGAAVGHHHTEILESDSAASVDMHQTEVLDDDGYATDRIAEARDAPQDR